MFLLLCFRWLCCLTFTLFDLDTEFGCASGLGIACDRVGDCSIAY